MKHLPNLLTAARLALTPYLFWLMVRHEYRTIIPWFIAIAVTDVVDGFLARKFHASSRLGALIAESPTGLMSRRLLAECRTFVASEGGRTGAVSGAHDDCVMAMALAMAVRAERLARSVGSTRMSAVEFPGMEAVA